MVRARLACRFLQKVWLGGRAMATAKASAELDRTNRTENPFRHTIKISTQSCETALLLAALMAGLIAVAVTVFCQLAQAIS